MKEFNVTHNAILTSEETPAILNPKSGEKCNHYNKVNEIEFYYKTSEYNFSQIKLSRDFIIDLANQIKRIESDLFEREYIDLPFC